MTKQIQQVRATARILRDALRGSGGALPGYAEKLGMAADDLERHAALLSSLPETTQ